MIVENIITSLKAKLATITWTPVGNSSATSFSTVFTAPTITGTHDSPWCYITDESPEIIKSATRGASGDLIYTKNQPITINICIQFDPASVTYQENMKRLRYATEAVETNIMRSGVYLATLIDSGWMYQSWTQFIHGEEKVLRRSLTLSLTDTV